MATHSSVLAWRIPGMAEPGGLPSVGSHRVRHDWSDLAAAAGSAYQWLLKLLIEMLMRNFGCNGSTWWTHWLIFMMCLNSIKSASTIYEVSWRGKKSLNLIKPPALSVNRKYRAQRNVLQNTTGIQSRKSRTGIILQDKCLGLVNKLQEKGGGLFKLKET